MPHGSEVDGLKERFPAQNQESNGVIDFYCNLKRQFCKVNIVLFAAHPTSFESAKHYKMLLVMFVSLKIYANVWSMHCRPFGLIKIKCPLS